MARFSFHQTVLDIDQSIKQHTLLYSKFAFFNLLSNLYRLLFLKKQPDKGGGHTGQKLCPAF